MMLCELRHDSERNRVQREERLEDETRYLDPIRVRDEAGVELLRVPWKNDAQCIVDARVWCIVRGSSRTGGQGEKQRERALSTDSRYRSAMRARLPSILLAHLVTLLGLLGGSVPASAQPSALRTQIASAVQEAGLGDGLGILVMEGEREIYALHADRTRNPASNMKVVTAAAALTRLGPDFTMLTGLYGRVENGTVGDLVLRGYGDPSLRMSDLVALAEGLADRGVTRVQRLWVDGSYFDDQILPPAFEQQPNETASFRAAVGAVAVERASYVLRVVPRGVGEAAEVRLAAADYFDINGTVSTSEGGNPNVIASQRAAEGGRLTLNLGGSVPAGILGVGYRRRVENPLVHAGYAMREALSRTGIRGRARLRFGEPPSGLRLITSRTSAPLAQLLHRVGKNSDNFYAEMILKVLGAERSRPGTSARGTEVLQELLRDAGVEEGAATIVNGSGLFDGNQIAPRHIVKVLQHVYANVGIRSEYLSHLSIGGHDGTLRRRLRNLPAERIVRAKTGTLNDVISLSGYVLGPEERVVTFSFLGNGVRGRQGAARQLADAIVRAIADELY